METLSSREIKKRGGVVEVAKWRLISPAVQPRSACGDWPYIQGVCASYWKLVSLLLNRGYRQTKIGGYGRETFKDNLNTSKNLAVDEVRSEEKNNPRTHPSWQPNTGGTAATPPVSIALRDCAF